MLIYALLGVGSLVFLRPFLWLAGKSFKVDREMFGECLHPWPQTPHAALRSPYIDTESFRDVRGPHQESAVALIEERLAAPELAGTLPPEAGSTAARQSIARGIYRRLLDRWPTQRWELPPAELAAQLAPWTRRSSPTCWPRCGGVCGCCRPGLFAERGVFGREINSGTIRRR